MPLNLLNRNSLLCTALCASLAALVLFSAPARAEDDDDGGPDIQLFKSVLSAVGLRSDAPNIDYRERSPLVIPSDTTKLRPPTAEEVKNPNWPVDPDTKRRRELAAAKARSLRDTGNPQIDDSRVLTPNELNAGRDRSKRNTGAGYTEWTGKPMSPSELGSPGLFNQLGSVFSSSDKEEVGKFTGEPPRTSLLDPPSGYQTPSPSQPYGVGKDKAGGPKAADYVGTHGTIEGVH
jgi:hypothetical protein